MVERMTRRGRAAATALVGSLCAAHAAHAQPLIDFGDGAPPRAVLSAAGWDWDEDDAWDEAYLVQGEFDADLWIVMGYAGDRLFVFPDVAWAGAYEGTRPWLETTAQGGLVVVSENMSIGRNRWRERLTLAYRDRRFIVAGYTYDSYDTLDLDATFSCDVNLITGRAIVDGVEQRTEPDPRPLRDWVYGERPDVCRAG